MAHKNIPVIAAIPNYNMAKGLKRLLPQILEQGYDQVYVLDDCSTDNSEEVVKSFGSRVKFVKSIVNGGAGAARNKIMPHIKEPSLIHFMDADISLVTKNNPELIRELPFDDTVSFIGGLIYEANGKQSRWNYGPRLSVATSTTGIIISIFPFFARIFKNRPHYSKPLKRRPTWWVLERSFVIESDTFIKFGGFDPTIREHDIQPLVFKCAKAGLTALFDPSFIVRSHQDINVRPYIRVIELIAAEFYISRKYGRMLYWFFPFLVPKTPIHKKQPLKETV